MASKKLFTVAKVKANANALALRWSLESTDERLSGLRHEAVQIVVFALEENEGNLVRTARDLGVDRRTMQRWLASFPQLRGAVDALGGGKAGRPVTDAAIKLSH